MRKYMIGLVCAFLLSSQSAFALVNGTLSPLTDPIPFPTTMALRFPTHTNAFCTAAKVGPRTFLIAAHCVFSGATASIKSGLTHGLTLEYTNLANPIPPLVSLPIPGPWFPITIDQTWVQPGILSGCGASCEVMSLVGTTADVAVIRTIEEIAPAIFPAYLDYTYVGYGNGVVIGGHGCEHGNDSTLYPKYPAGYSRLSYHSTATQDGATIFRAAGLPAMPDSHLFFTPGYPMSSSEASVCQGDSGGPVYRNDGARHNIVGVNSGLFSVSSNNEAIVNVHSRIATVESWLRGIVY